MYYWLAGETKLTDADDEGTDAFALSRGLISVTPVHYDLTRYDVLEELRGVIGKIGIK